MRGIIELDMADIELSKKETKSITIKPCRYDPMAQVEVTGKYLETKKYSGSNKYYIDSLIHVLCMPELNEPPRPLESGDWVTLTGTFLLELDE